MAHFERVTEAPYKTIQEMKLCFQISLLPVVSGRAWYLGGFTACTTLISSFDPLAVASVGVPARAILGTVKISLVLKTLLENNTEPHR